MFFSVVQRRSRARLSFGALGCFTSRERTDAFSFVFLVLMDENPPENEYASVFIDATLMKNSPEISFFYSISRVTINWSTSLFLSQRNQSNCWLTDQKDIEDELFGIIFSGMCVDRATSFLLFLSFSIEKDFSSFFIYSKCKKRREVSNRNFFFFIFAANQTK